MNNARLSYFAAIAAVVTLMLPMRAGAFSIFQEVGPDAASIQATVDIFRAALGNPNNVNAPGPLFSGRREINWDGGGQATTISPTPFNGFQNIRGALFTTSGTGFVQAPPSGLATDPTFGNPTYASFAVFSSARSLVQLAARSLTSRSPSQGRTAVPLPRSRGSVPYSRTLTPPPMHRSAS
jgi:hypothetical protein